jgi:chemotaxis protein histidine kinase CheA
MQEKSGNVVVLFSDDGQGLNLQKIREMAVTRNLLTTDEMNDPLLLADLIFDSGLSTADRLTEISGRGIGMGAVRRFIQESGGQIEVVLLEGQDMRAVFWPFLLAMTFPGELFDWQTTKGIGQAA